jgi:hypothetical protein
MHFEENDENELEIARQTYGDKNHYCDANFQRRDSEYR